MEVVLNDNGLLEYTKTDIAKPSTSDAQQLAQWKKDTTKARRIILSESETMLFRVCMESKLLMQCGRPLETYSKAAVMPRN